MSFMKVLGKMGLADTDEKPEAETKPAAQVLQEAPQAQEFFAPGIAAMGGTVADSDETYQKVKSRSDFEATPEFAAIQKYLKPLEALPLDPTTKFKTAITQAQALEGLTSEKIVAAIDGCLGALDAQTARFNEKSASFAETEVAARQRRMLEITEQIAALQAEHTKLSGEVMDAQSKGARAQGSFTAAVQRRRSELEQLKVQYTNLLKG